MASKRVISKSKPVVDASAKELRKIERLLGEEFDTLAQARRALKRESKPVSERALKTAKAKAQVKRALAAPSKLPAKLPNKKNYTIRELNGSQKRALNTLIYDNQTAIQLDDKLLKPGEQWGAIVPHKYTGRDLEQHTGHARTFQLYGRLDQLFKKLTEYAQHGMKLTKAKREKFLSDIKIVKWGSPDKTLRENRMDWHNKSNTEKAQRKERKAGVKKLISDVNKRNRVLEKKNKELEAKLAAQKTAKSAAKKTAKKKAASKSTKKGKR